MGIFTQKVERDEDDKFIPAPFSAPRPITAAAAPINLADKTELSSLSKRRSVHTWQGQAWDYFDLIGEIKFSATFLASVVSRVRLFPAYVVDDDLAPSVLKNNEEVDPELIKDVQRVMRKLGSGNGGVPGMLQDAALNLFIAGECYLVQEPAKAGSGKKERWTIRSIDEIVSRGGKNAGLYLKPSRSSTGTGEENRLPPRAAVQRIWRMHPRYSEDADSSMLGLLELCDELLLLNKSSRGAAKSQLNAGAVTVPDTMSDTSQSDGEIDDDPDTMADYSDDETDSFEEDFLKAMTTPIADEGSASSVSPLIIRGPIEALNAIRHITFDRKFDETSAERAKTVLERILAGLDIPKEIVQGIADAKYANAVQVEETLYKAHVEPMALLLCDAFTDAFLHPMLRALGWTDEDIENIVIWYDPSAITAKPSKAEAATTGYQQRILSSEAWRRANGFSETDKPEPMELLQRTAVERGILSEPMTDAIFRSLAPELMAEIQAQQQAASPDGTQVLDKISGGNPGNAAPNITEAPSPVEEPEAPSTGPSVPLIEP